MEASAGPLGWDQWFSACSCRAQFTTCTQTRRHANTNTQTQEHTHKLTSIHTKLSSNLFLFWKMEGKNIHIKMMITIRRRRRRRWWCCWWWSSSWRVPLTRVCGDFDLDRLTVKFCHLLVKNDPQRPTGTYRDPQRPIQTHRDPQRPTWTYRDPRGTTTMSTSSWASIWRHWWVRTFLSEFLCLYFNIYHWWNSPTQELSLNMSHFTSYYGNCLCTCTFHYLIHKLYFYIEDF